MPVVFVEVLAWSEILGVFFLGWGVGGGERELYHTVNVTTKMNHWFNVTTKMNHWFLPCLESPLDVSLIVRGRVTRQDSVHKPQLLMRKEIWSRESVWCHLISRHHLLIIDKQVTSDWLPASNICLSVSLNRLVSRWHQTDSQPQISFLYKSWQYQANAISTAGPNRLTRACTETFGPFTPAEMSRLSLGWAWETGTRACHA